MTKERFNHIVKLSSFVLLVLIAICLLGIIWGSYEFWGKILLSIIVIAGAVTIVLPCPDESD